MLPGNHPDRIQIAFDDHRLVANAGLILPATLALRLGLPHLIGDAGPIPNPRSKSNADSVPHPAASDSHPDERPTAECDANSPSHPGRSDQVYLLRRRGLAPGA